MTVLAFGTGKTKDSTIEMLATLADEENGNYAYVETLTVARKVVFVKPPRRSARSAKT